MATNGHNASLALAKRLLYILRYGALREGLEVDPNGFVKLDDLLTVDLLKASTKEEVLELVKDSVSKIKNVSRFDLKEENGITYIRAAYLRCLEKSAYHTGTKVLTLQETALKHVMNNLDDYDLENFPEEEIIRTMIRRLKLERRLNSKALKALLVPTVTRLDMEGVYLTKSTLKAIWTQCPSLKAISLQDCGYIITDMVLTQFVKNLPSIERLNLSGCNHLTPKCLNILNKHLPNLRKLNISWGPTLTFQAVLDFLVASNNLEVVDFYSLKTSLEEYNTLMEAASQKNINLVVRQPKGIKSDGLEETDEKEDSLENGIV